MQPSICPTLNTAEKVKLITDGGQTINTEGTTMFDCEHVVDCNVRLGLHNSIAVGLIHLGPDRVQNQETEVWEFSDLFDTTVLGFSMGLQQMHEDEDEGQQCFKKLHRGFQEQVNEENTTYTVRNLNETGPTLIFPIVFNVSAAYLKRQERNEALNIYFTLKC